MATLTGDRKHRGSHLKLVHSRDDARPMNVEMGALLDLDDPNPGPRDASMLVGRFATVLPSDVECDGLFSLGESG